MALVFRIVRAASSAPCQCPECQTSRVAARGRLPTVEELGELARKELDRRAHAAAVPSPIGPRPASDLPTSHVIKPATDLADVFKRKKP